MNEENKKIDELFSQGLSQPDIPFLEADWADMKSKLEKDKRRRGLIWWTGMSGAAAALLVALAWWGVSLEPQHIPVKVAKAPINQKLVLPTEADKVEEESPEQKDPSPATVERSAGSQIAVGQSSAVAYKHSEKAQRVSKERIATAEVVTTFETEEQLAVSMPPKDDAKLTAQNDNMPAPVSNALANVSKTDPTLALISKKDSSRVIAKTETKFKPSLILSLTAAPDISAVKSFTNNQLGFNGGLLATVTLSPRLSISSGAVLAKKMYGTAFANYNPNSGYKFLTNPVNVNADCRVIDIPLNVNYTFLQKGKSSLQLSAGASSYIMLTEKYEYQYASKYAKGPYEYEVRGLNRHYFGVGNVAVAYQRKLNSTTAISIQPYLKLPLTDIGYGNVKLLSTGVAINLDMNISTIIKGK